MAKTDAPSNEKGLKCMDFREEGGNVRIAGPVIDALSDETIQSAIEEDAPGRPRIRLNVHRDCGLVKIVARILDDVDTGLSQASVDALEQAVVRHFRERGGFEGATTPDGDYNEKLKQLEDFHLELEETRLKERLAAMGRSDVKVVAVIDEDLPTNLHSGIVIAAIGNPNESNDEVFKAQGLKTGDAYLIRAGTADECAISLEAGKKFMKKTDLRVVGLDDTGRQEAEVLQQKPFMRTKNHLH